jgi:Concanavalin A-like lectin/glucanases superfamily
MALLRACLISNFARQVDIAAAPSNPDPPGLPQRAVGLDRSTEILHHVPVNLRVLLVAARFVAVLLVSASCGRFHFDGADVGGDAAIDAPTDSPGVPSLSELFVDCLLRMEMDEPSWTGVAGEVKDSCAGRNGQALAGVTTVADSVRGRVGEFDGVSQCVQVADAAMLQPTTAMTMSAWILPTALSPNSFGVMTRRTSFGVSAAYSLFLWTGDTGGMKNRLYVDIDSENDRVFDPNAEFLNTWTQVTVVYDGARDVAERVRFYVDGKLSFVTKESSTAIAALESAPPFSVGCLPLEQPAQSFIGRLDEVVVWARALSAVDVETWYKASVR